MGKPRLIILIRHAQSEGNKNRDIHQTEPDHRVKLTPDGWKQAAEAGAKLRALLHPSDTLHFFTSPYKRTRETTEGVLNALTSSTPNPSPFERSTIKVYEEPRLREQDFGNFQPSSAEMSRMWQERANYGHFFYRIPNGESAADAYDRISGFNESLWRSFGEDDFASVCVLVTHGLMTRVFLMKWYHYSVEYFEDLRNVNHCEFVVMKLNPDSGKFILQNELRTWSGLRREKAEALAQPESPIPVRKRWGDYGTCFDQDASGFGRRQLARRRNTADLFMDEDEPKAPTPQDNTTTSRDPTPTPDSHPNIIPRSPNSPQNHPFPLPPPPPPPAPPSAHQPARSHTGGSRPRSGAASPSSPSDEDEDEDEEVRDHLRALPVRSSVAARTSMAMALHGELENEMPGGGRARADALGDRSDDDDDDDGKGEARGVGHEREVY